MTKSAWSQIRDEENEEFRVLNCGKFCMILFDPSLKKFKVNRFYCGKFLSCSTCMERRVAHFKKTLSVPSMVFAVSVSDTDYAGLKAIKSIGPSYYTLCPREDGITTFFLASTADNRVSMDKYSHRHPVLLQDISDKEFEFILSTPKGRRVVGFATKNVGELNLIFNNKPLDDANTRNMSIGSPFLTVKVDDHKLEEMFSEIKMDRAKYPDDYSSEDAVATLQTICRMHIRILETMMKKQLIFPKVKTDTFNFEFPASYFKTEQKFDWAQDDIF